MSTPTYDSLVVGQALPELRLPPINRSTLAYFAGASGDDNPIHIDIDFARRAGMPDVFAHGMLGMAYLARLLTQWVPQQALRSFGVRFMAITHLGNEPVLSGRVVEKLEEAGEKRVRLEVQMANQYGDVKILGTAVVALS
jgi:acyl dehydratase